MLATTNVGPVADHVCVRASLAVLEDMLAGLDDRTGVLHLGVGDSDARICVHKGRVAWVHAGAEGGYLSQRLAVVMMMTRAELVELLLRCRREQRHLGELVVALDLLSEDDFRALMLEHNREHLRVLLSRDEDVTWSFEDRTERYKEAFTFEMSELVSEGWLPPSSAPSITTLHELIRELDFGSRAHVWIKTPRHVVCVPDAPLPSRLDVVLCQATSAVGSRSNDLELLATSIDTISAIGVVRRDTALVLEYPLTSSRSGLMSGARVLRTLRRGTAALRAVLASNRMRREPARTPASTRAVGPPPSIPS